MSNQKQYVLAVPNFSEGRDLNVVEEIVSPLRSMEGLNTSALNLKATLTAPLSQ